MHYVYVIENLVTKSYYIGYTNNPKNRWNSHVWSVKNRRKSKLYSNMRKYGLDNFEFVILQTFQEKQEALNYEISQIDLTDSKCLNLSSGGDGGYTIPEEKKQEWRNKLSKARKGGKPALGMKHTEDNKKKFSEISRRFWDTQETYDSTEILKHSFKGAKTIYGISKTHYYRLRKRTKINDLG